MTEPAHRDPAFNLWNEPWIDLERPDGALERLGIAETLLRAAQFHGIYSHSPLEVAGLHRLLTAILQDIFCPTDAQDLRSLFQKTSFPGEPIEGFGETYGQAFDLFSRDRPFMQSADLPVSPDRQTPSKTAAYLSPELPSGTGTIHYRHSLEDEQIYCPVCCARGLTIVPAFATSGGAGIKPSINGVPPIYIIPGGQNLFESLRASLILPQFQPAVRDRVQDFPAWRHDAVVGKSEEVYSVGYLHSLTFPARRIRLHPQFLETTCTRCGEVAGMSVRSMVFQMGESRPKDSAFWQDPFAAYYKRENEAPLPMRPSAGKAAWRDYGSLFLKMPGDFVTKRGRSPLRPRLVDQIDHLVDTGMIQEENSLSFRCIGMRTDMKAKIFEWVDTGFDVPLALLQSSSAGLDIEDALTFADECGRTVGDVFTAFLNEHKKNPTRHTRDKANLLDRYWDGLANEFRSSLVGDLARAQPAGQHENREKIRARLTAWYRLAISTAQKELERALDQVGEDGRSLRQRSQCLEEANKRLYGKLKKKEI